MKISIIIPEMVSIGGGQKFVSEVSRIWEKKHDVEIHTLYWNRKNWDIEGINALKEREKMDSAFNLYSPFMIKKLEKQATAEVYNTHLFPANWFGKKPHVWYAHDPPRMLYDLYEDVTSGLGWTKRAIVSTYFPLLKKMDKQKSLKNVDYFIGNSKYCAGYLEAVYGKKAQFVYPGVDCKRFKPSKPHGCDFLAVTRLHAAKRVDVCIKAMALIKDESPNARLRIAGEGPERKKLESLARTLGLEQRVSFLGAISERQLLDEYERAYAICYLPKREPFGLVPLEAGAAGKPVIAVDEGGCKETVLSGKTGFLVKPAEQKVAEAAIQLMQDKALAAKMGREGRRNARQFSWKKTAKELLDVLKQA